LEEDALEEGFDLSDVGGFADVMGKYVEASLEPVVQMGCRKGNSSIRKGRKQNAFIHYHFGTVAVENGDFVQLSRERSHFLDTKYFPLRWEDFLGR
jgi:hypothetical protein